MYPTSYCSSTGAIGASKCPIATNIWSTGGWPSLESVCVSNNRSFISPFLERHVSRHLYQEVTIGLFIKIHRKRTMLFFSFNWGFINIGQNFVFLPEIIQEYGMISLIKTNFWRPVKWGRGLNFDMGEVLDSCGLAVHKSIKAHLSLCDMCGSVFMSCRLQFVLVICYKFSYLQVSSWS